MRNIEVCDIMLAWRLDLQYVAIVIVLQCYSLKGSLPQTDQQLIEKNECVQTYSLNSNWKIQIE